ncbi:MAG: fibronectin type III-like domain-contianing protein, partial [Anaerolineae bacterium]|nr:fibronectin type III-like domain-contianing protein [Anaerolineae bacterium]
FQRIHLAAGEQQTVTFTISPEQMSFFDDAEGWTLQPGDFRVWAGGQQPDLKADVQPGNVVAGAFAVV